MERNQRALARTLLTDVQILQTMPLSQHITMQRTSFKIYSDTPEAIQLCLAYLTPYIHLKKDCSQPVSHEITVYFKDIATSPLATQLRELIESTPASEPARLLNFDDDHFAGLPIESSFRLIYDPLKKDLFLLADLKQASITILDTSSQPQRAQFALIRTLRNLARYRSENSTHYPLHAAAACLNDRAILLTGDKYTGKTTLLAALLTYTKANFLSNDRVALEHTTSRVTGWPYSPGVRPGTAQTNPCLQTYFRELLHDSYPPNKEKTEADPRRFLQEPSSSQKTFRFPPQVFCDIFQKRIVPEATLHLILNPVYDPEAKRPLITPLSPENAFTLLTNQTGRSAFFDPWWYPSRSPKTEDEYYQHLAHTCPVLQIRQNERLLQQTGELLAELCDQDNQHQRTSPTERHERKPA